MEEWRDIAGYEGLYQVSSFGGVRSVDRLVREKGGGKQQSLKGKELKPCANNYGYLNVTLCKDGVRKRVYVHRLVAEAFVPNPEKLTEVNHKDENKANNRADNLEWCTNRYNVNYGAAREKHAEKCKKPVLMIVDGKTVREFSSVSEAARELGVSSGCISYHCRHQAKRDQGRKLEYK